MPDPLPPPPTAVGDLAEACARFVERALGVRLDGTQDTLPLLDHYLAQVAEGKPSDDLVGLVAPAAGAYFGEVLRIALGEGAWELDPAAPDDARLVLAGGRLRIAPTQAALEAILGRVPEDAPPVLEAPRDAETVRAALAVFGEVREDDFFRLSVRYDAIVMVHARVGPAAVPTPHDVPPGAGSNGASA